MKKILLVMSVAILIALCSAPSIVYAANTIGQACRIINENEYVVAPVYCIDDRATTIICNSPSFRFENQNGWYITYASDGFSDYTTKDNTVAMYIPTYPNQNVIEGVYITNDYDDFLVHLPAEEDPSLAQQRWDAFYDWFYEEYGFYPVEGSLIDILRNMALGDDDAGVTITFPTLTPTPTPTPRPTPIPVQTIYVPDGNGNTTIIYQYTDPNTGVITQSPYNPNIENNIEINCDCDGNDSDGPIFGYDPTDPTSLTSSILWADGFGVEISDNPLTAANDSQKSLADAAAEYTDSVNIVSNSFNILPFKWLMLVGLLGGILIIAGLLRTFLGG